MILSVGIEDYSYAITMISDSKLRVHQLLREAKIICFSTQLSVNLKRLNWLKGIKSLSWIVNSSWWNRVFRENYINNMTADDMHPPNKG